MHVDTQYALKKSITASACTHTLNETSDVGGDICCLKINRTGDEQPKDDMSQPHYNLTKADKGNRFMYERQEMVVVDTMCVPGVLQSSLRRSERWPAVRQSPGRGFRTPGAPTLSR